MSASANALPCEQEPDVQSYFVEVCAQDKYRLNVVHFFRRVYGSLVMNGLKRTCEFYDLDEKIIKLIKIEG